MQDNWREQLKVKELEVANFIMFLATATFFLFILLSNMILYKDYAQTFASLDFGSSIEDIP